MSEVRDQKLIADPRKAVRDPIYHGRGSLGSNLARWPGLRRPKQRCPGALARLSFPLELYKSATAGVFSAIYADVIKNLFIIWSQLLHVTSAGYIHWYINAVTT
ncbi:hypothetical protein EVAR_91956_1 [Eumeta japonica]|uniref:Uncharacterized protein n=1 Tax=Eumeta variegata TaxID=151549 RepID=A0A4C2ACT5_EUMVA|nr:hypothetical protein EVAR_91956_1 [Eumeta japonica]